MTELENRNLDGRLLEHAQEIFSRYSISEAKIESFCDLIRISRETRRVARLRSEMDERANPKKELDLLVKETEALLQTILTLSHEVSHRVWGFEDARFVELSPSEADAEAILHPVANLSGDDRKVWMMHDTRARLVDELKALLALSQEARSNTHPKKGGKRPNPDLDQFITLMFQFWQCQLHRKFTFNQEVIDGKQDSVTQATDFCVDCALLVDPDISRTDIISAIRRMLPTLRAAFPDKNT